MSKIIEKYNFNVPKYKTDSNKNLLQLTKKGKHLCIKECQQCSLFENECKGCNIICPDKFCYPDDERCKRCVVKCHRFKDSEKYLRLLKHNIIKDNNGFNIKNNYIPAINKRLKNSSDFECISIPFYAIYDFNLAKIKVIDIRKRFNLNDNTKIIINFYMKDDKILFLFDEIINGNFWIELNKIKSQIDFIHSVCFSVFEVSNNFDQVFNFRRQLWIGDLMRQKSYNVIQEALITGNDFVRADLDYYINEIKKREIKKIGLCCQLLNGDEGLINLILLMRNFTMKYSGKILLTGIGKNKMNQIKNISNKIYFLNYNYSYGRGGL